MKGRAVGGETDSRNVCINIEMGSRDSQAEQFMGNLYEYTPYMGARCLHYVNVVSAVARIKYLKISTSPSSLAD